MAAGGDVTIAHNGGNVKLHPYVTAILRWCVSCVWSAATVLVHRLLTAPSLPPLAIKAPQLPEPPSRAARSNHLHPESRVECQVLHQPACPPAVDFIFLHGLYGSLENTWRQGDWRSKYKIEPNRVPLRRPSAIPSPCDCDDCICRGSTPYKQANKDTKYCMCDNDFDIDDERGKEDNEICKIDDTHEASFTNIDEAEFYTNTLKNILPKDEIIIAEEFYSKTVVVDNFEAQAKFVEDLFKFQNCDIESDISLDANDENHAPNNYCDKSKNCADDKSCEIGCGCICDKCYSLCWPQDWLKIDFPEARVISVNYTSDPYLWRPLWIKECKRLRLHERAEQMTEQLLQLGVGRRPIIWVGHSKGGLFIKQIYAEAYEAYLKTHPNEKPNNTFAPEDKNNETGKAHVHFETECQNDNKLNHQVENIDNMIPKIDITDELSSTVHNVDINSDTTLTTSFKEDDCNNNIGDAELDNANDTRNAETNYAENDNDSQEIRSDETVNEEIEGFNLFEVNNELKDRGSIWENTAGFMFYSVPHRGSPLANIKTPITARSIELLEISQDSALVLSLQQRWLDAVSVHAPAVRSLVETCRTLMTLLWLRIVSVDSADAGIGALCGVSVDHREICKPSSRSCILYTELVNLVHASLDRWHCQNKARNS